MPVCSTEYPETIWNQQGRSNDKQSIKNSLETWVISEQKGAP